MGRLNGLNILLLVVSAALAMPTYSQAQVQDFELPPIPEKQNAPAVAAPVPVNAKYEKLNPDDFLVPLDQAVLAGHESFTGVVLVSKNSQILFEQGYNKVPGSDADYSKDTRFLLASMTKQFTAALVLKFVDRKIIKLDDKIGMYIPNAPRSWDKITISDLLTHTSGFRTDYLSTKTPCLYRDENALLNHVKKMVPAISSNKRFFYNNVNYFLLGIILENSSGIHLHNLMQKEVTSPLEMERSGMIPPTAARAAALYSSENEPQAAQPACYFAVGNMYSSVDDLFKWEESLFGGAKILSQASFEAMMTEQPGTEHKYSAINLDALSTLKTVSLRRRNRYPMVLVSDGYGLGVRISKINGKTIIWHSGHLTNHTTLVEHYLEDNVTVIVLTNQSNYPVFDVAHDVVRKAFDLPSVPPPLKGYRRYKAPANIKPLALKNQLENS